MDAPGSQDGKPAKPAESRRRQLVEFASITAIMCGAIAGVGAIVQWRNERTLASGVETTAEIMGVVRRSTQSIQGSAARDKYFIDFRWRSNGTSREREDREISDAYARRLGLATWTRGNGTVVRIHYRPHDPAAPPVLLDDRGFYGSMSSGLLAGLAVGFGGLGSGGLFALRQARRRAAEIRHRGPA